MKIEIKNLVKHFGKVKAVDDISFSFNSGHIFGFVGPNGAGKTTTIRMMATLDSPDAGDIFFDNVSATENPEEIHKMIGYMPDSLPTHSDLTVWEYLDFFARAYGIKGKKRVKVLKYIEEFTNLGGMRKTYIKVLSKGMKQRVSIARALIHDPKILIMDEPAAGLDPRARVELRELLKILADSGKAVLISSHILTELEDMCHGAVIIEKGKVLKTGLISELHEKTDTSLTGVFIRSIEKSEDLLKNVLQMPFVEKAALATNDEVFLELKGRDNECQNLLISLIESNSKIVEFRQQNIGLEEIFMNITKGEVS